LAFTTRAGKRGVVIATVLSCLERYRLRKPDRTWEEAGEMGRTRPSTDNVVLGWVRVKGLVCTEAIGIRLVVFIVNVEFEGSEELVWLELWRETVNGNLGMVNWNVSGRGFTANAVALTYIWLSREETLNPWRDTRRPMAGKGGSVEFGDGRPGTCGTRDE
jgi:hypothetical protein